MGLGCLRLQASNGLKPTSIFTKTYAALKRRSSTVLQTSTIVGRLPRANSKGPLFNTRRRIESASDHGVALARFLPIRNGSGEKLSRYRNPFFQLSPAGSSPVQINGNPPRMSGELRPGALPAKCKASSKTGEFGLKVSILKIVKHLRKDRDQQPVASELPH